MESKIRIKLGPIEIEYEGTEAFLKKDLMDLLSSVSDLYAKSGISSAIPAELKSNDGSRRPLIEGTTGSFASKLAVKQGTELILAAAAQLTLVSNKARFSRKEIVAEMKSASAYFKKAYVSNLSNYLNTLIKEGKLLEPSSGVYSLSATTLKTLKPTLTQT